MGPTIGMLAVVRNRCGVISRVAASAPAMEGVLHLVTIDFSDSDGGREETLVWEREPSARIIEATGLPRVGDTPAMPPAQFAAMVRASRWGAVHPYIDPDTSAGPLERLPLTSPMHGAIEVEDYQMVPLLKAMRMPRVTLLLADDVGLGKTVEAGLVMGELVLQRRIQRILILTPASLRGQWREEMQQKFCMNFEVVDRAQTQLLRRRLGIEANPWRCHPHIVASYHYLKQPDVLEEFLATCRTVDGSPHLPWDLLVVDEAHNLAPAAFGDDSELSKMLRTIAPYFEHKIFATATPHNGRTRCFSGLLEILDPARFSQASEFTPAERSRVQEVLVRRLKSEINAVTNPPRFSDRQPPQALPLQFSSAEARLALAFGGFRRAVQTLTARVRGSERVAGAFAAEVLGKRLLSCAFAFADSWHRTLDGLRADEPAPATEVRMSERAVREETGDDREAESRTAHAVRVIGAWLKPLEGQLNEHIENITNALGDLGLGDAGAVRPNMDARYSALRGLVQRLLKETGGEWRENERLVVFTEFKTTLDYLVGRLREDFPGDGVVLELFGVGDMDENERKAVTDAFNDPTAAVRILVATDAASEGLNLQTTARYLLHFDVPWNPARIEQRNGRIDRYGQARDVSVFHFSSDDDADLNFLAYVVTKVHHIRNDLGSTGEIFDAAVQRRLIECQADEDVRRDMERSLELAQGRANIPRDPAARSRDVSGEVEGERLEVLRRELDLNPDSLRQTVEIAMSHQVGLPRLREDGRANTWRLVQPIPGGWQDVVDEALRVQRDDGSVVGALPAITFDAAACVKTIAGRPVFRPDVDVALLHLWHPVIQQSLQFFARIRFPGTATSVSRWTVSNDPSIPAGTDAWILLTLEELGVNELRETFHHWVRTVVVPVRNGDLGEPLPHRPAADYARSVNVLDNSLLSRAGELWLDVEAGLRDLVLRQKAELTQQLTVQLAQDRLEAARTESERFQSRQGELSQLITETRMDRLEREIDLLTQERNQGVLFDPDNTLARLRDSMESKESELRRLRLHIEDLREQLNRERDRVLNLLIPRRFTLRGEAQCLPVAVEIRFREARP